MKTLPLFFAAALAALLPAVPAFAGEGRPIDERRPLKANARVSVTNVAGSIEVVAWERNELHLTGELAAGAEELVISGSESALEIEVKVPRRQNQMDDTVLMLKVPAGIVLEAEGVSADIRVDGLRGAIDVESVSGDITVKAVSPSIEAQTVSGDVTLEGASGEVRAGSVSGDVHVRGTRGELYGESVSGDVVVQAREVRKLELESVSGDLDLSLELAAGAVVKVESLSGQVRLALPRLPDGVLEMESFSGDLDSAWSPGPGSARQFRHDGGGKGRVSVTSFSGDIILKKR